MKTTKKNKWSILKARKDKVYDTYPIGVDQSIDMIVDVAIMISKTKSVYGKMDALCVNENTSPDIPTIIALKKDVLYDCISKLIRHWKKSGLVLDLKPTEPAFKVEHLR